MKKTISRIYYYTLKISDIIRNNVIQIKITYNKIKYNLNIKNTHTHTNTILKILYHYIKRYFEME